MAAPSVDSSGAIFGNLGSVEFVHKVEFSLPNVAAATGIVAGGVLVVGLLFMLVRTKTKKD